MGPPINAISERDSVPTDCISFCAEDKAHRKMTFVLEIIHTQC